MNDVIMIETFIDMKDVLNITIIDLVVNFTSSIFAERTKFDGCY